MQPEFQNFAEVRENGKKKKNSTRNRLSDILNKKTDLNNSC